MKRTIFALSFIQAMWLCIDPVTLRGQEVMPNYDESKVPEYTLPDPLVSSDGTRVTDASTWFGKRRAEILQLFTEQVYGKAPGPSEDVRYSTIDSSKALDGVATRKQVSLTFSQGQKELSVTLLLYIPNNRPHPVPGFLGLNFSGNHSISKDPGIRLNTNWMRPNKAKGIVNNRATEASRGNAASRWPIKMVLQRGYAVATAYYGDIDPDYDDGFHNGVHSLFSQPGNSTSAQDEWGSIGAWAWGLSRIMDYLETDGAIDHQRIVVMGHSRLGKTSLWAGAQDERFAMVISNNSGCGGAALSSRRYGETVGVINSSFPHWFCKNFKQYNDKENLLPVDQHMLLSLIAPRPLYVASAEEDRWADPKGEYLALKNADPVYRLVGTDGLADRVPVVNQSLIGTLSYHIRSGEHNVTHYDWEQYLKWADRFLMDQ
jgi:(4-O-methyl)-D-glucuronate---lignin esterase